MACCFSGDHFSVTFRHWTVNPYSLFTNHLQISPSNRIVIICFIRYNYAQTPAIPLWWIQHPWVPRPYSVHRSHDTLGLLLSLSLPLLLEHSSFLQLQLVPATIIGLPLTHSSVSCSASQYFAISSNVSSSSFRLPWTILKNLTFP